MKQNLYDKLIELAELAEKENEPALLAILHAVAGAYCNQSKQHNHIVLLAKHTQDYVRTVLYPLHLQEEEQKTNLMIVKTKDAQA